MHKQRRRGIRRPRRHYQASADIQHIHELPPGTPVVLWCRVSGTRHKAGPQLDALRAAARAAGLRVVGERVVTAPAHKAAAELAAAGNLAARNGAMLLAECNSRFVRATTYHAAHAPHRRAGRWTVKEACDTVGVPLATVLHPGATNKEERAYQMKRTQQYTGNYGGRPPKRLGYKKRLRTLNMSKVYWLAVVGFSVRGTARRLGKSPNQIQRWRDKLRGK